MRLAEIVDACPQKLSGDVVVVGHCAPVLESVAVLAAEERLVRKCLVVLCVQVFPVIVPSDVDGVDKAKLCGELGEGGGKRYRMRGVHCFYNAAQMLCQHSEALGVGARGIVHALRLRFVGVVVAGNAVAWHSYKARMTVGIVGIVDLVSDAPQDHARVVAVAQDHVGEIALVPDGEIGVVALIFRGIDIVSLPPFVLWPLPLVKRLVHHEEAEDVAQRVQLGHVRIVAHADRVAAHFPEQDESAAPYLVGNGGAKAACVVMQADALELVRFPVEKKAPVRVKAKAADTDLHLMDLIRFLVGDICFHSVQIWTFRRPEPGCLYGSGIGDLYGGVRHDGCLRYGLAHQLSGIVKDDIGDSDQAVLVCRVDQFIDDLVVGAVIVDSRRVEEDAVVGGIDVFGYGERDFSRDAGACEPARVG